MATAGGLVAGRQAGGAVAIAVAIASSTMWVALPAVAIVGLSISCAGIAIQSSIAAQPRYPRLELFWAPRSNA